MPPEILAIIITSSISTVTIVVSILAVFISLSKKIDNVKNELTSLNSKFDRLDERQIATNQRISKLETDVKDDIKELKNDSKTIISKAIDKISTPAAASLL